MQNDHDRRRFLAVAAGTATLALAGCSAAPTDGGDGSTPESDPPRQTDDQTATASRTHDPKPMSTVFHFARGPDSQKHALANVANLLEDPSTDVEDVVLVANGRGIELLVASESVDPDGVAALLDRGVAFRACENSMAALDVEASALVDGVETVPAGVGELTRLQVREDFAYIETP